MSLIEMKGRKSGKFFSLCVGNVVIKSCGDCSEAPEMWGKGIDIDGVAVISSRFASLAEYAQSEWAWYGISNEALCFELVRAKGGEGFIATAVIANESVIAVRI